MGAETEFFSYVQTQAWRKSSQFAYNLTNANQKLGFSVMRSNLRVMNRDTVHAIRPLTESRGERVS